MPSTKCVYGEAVSVECPVCHDRAIKWSSYTEQNEEYVVFAHHFRCPCGWRVDFRGGGMQ